jgi:rare lipoprotein A
MVKTIKNLILLVLCISSFLSFAQTKNKKLISDKKATYYHNNFVNRKTSTGEIFDQSKYTAAHRTIPLNTLVKVTNKDNGRSVIVRINDRCPKRGVIDLSLIAAKRLRMIEYGVASVKIEVLSNDYLDIWEKQDEMFCLFDRAKEKDSVRNIYFDSIIFVKENKLQESFLFARYVRLTTAESRSEAKKIIDQLPNKYKYITKAVIGENNKFYYINIGPFVSFKTAQNVVKELKGIYPQIHILEKKNTE